MLQKLKELGPNTVPQILEQWKGSVWRYKDKDEPVDEKIVSPFVYAHGAVKISELCEWKHSPGLQPDQPFRPHVCALVEFVIGDFVNRAFFLGKEREVQLTEKLAASIIDRYGDRLSVFGLAHCLYCLENKVEPVNKIKLYGTDLMAIKEALSIYIGYCRVRFAEFEKEMEVKKQLAEFDKNYAIPQEIWKEHEALIRRLPAPKGNFIDELRKRRNR